MNKFFQGVCLVLLALFVGQGVGDKYRSHMAELAALRTEWRGKRVKFKLGGSGYVREVNGTNGEALVRYIANNEAQLDRTYYIWELEKAE